MHKFWIQKVFVYLCENPSNCWKSHSLFFFKAFQSLLGSFLVWPKTALVLYIDGVHCFTLLTDPCLYCQQHSKCCSAACVSLQYSLWREWAPWNQHRYCGTMYADTIPTNQMQPKRRVVLAVIMSFWLCACCFSEPAWSSTGAGVPVNKLILSCAFQTVTQKWSNRKKKERPNREVTFHVYFISVC